MTPKIQERAEAKYPYKDDLLIGPVQNERNKAIVKVQRNAYIAGATEQQSLSEARIKELEEENHTLKELFDSATLDIAKLISSKKELEGALKVIKLTWPLSQTATEVINKALNK